MATSALTDWASFRALDKSDSPWNSRNALSRPIRELRPPASTKAVRLEFDETHQMHKRGRYVLERAISQILRIKLQYTKVTYSRRATGPMMGASGRAGVT